MSRGLLVLTSVILFGLMNSGFAQKSLTIYGQIRDAQQGELGKPIDQIDPARLENQLTVQEAKKLGVDKNSLIGEIHQIQSGGLGHQMLSPNQFPNVCRVQPNRCYPTLKVPD